MTGDFLPELDRLRRRIRIARTVEQAVRWAFYAALLICGCLAALKILAVPVPPVAAFAVIGLSAVAAITIQTARRFSRLDCAILLDRRLKLDERLSTAISAEGPMADALRRDAGEAWSGADKGSVVPRFHRELGWLAATLLFVGVLALAPTPGAEPDALNPALSAAARRAADRLKESGDPELRKIASELEEASTAEDVAAALKKLRIAEGKAGGKDGNTDVEDAAADAGTTLSSALARSGRLPDDLRGAPPALSKKFELNRDALAGGTFGSEAGKTRDPGTLRLGGVETTAARKSAVRALARAAWDPEYDDVVTDYFEVKK